MEAHRSKSNRKRKQEQESRPSALRKSQRLLDKLQSPSISLDEQNEPDEPMKITGLNDDCLQKIFEYLGLRGLLNVADANKWLKPAANDVYKRRFGMKTVDISNNWFDVPFESSPYQITIAGLKWCLQFLRCLGASINSLEILCGEWNEKQCKYIHQYVNQYCAESLSKIQFTHKRASIPIGPFEKPFVNIRVVRVYNSDLHNQLPSFAEWFPNMRSLIMTGGITLHHFNALNFDHLNDLCIHVTTNNYGLKINEAAHLLQQLPQLHTLHILATGYTLNQLLKIIKNNRVICNLKVDMYKPTVAATALDIQLLINEHPALIELEFIGLELGLNRITELISQLNALKLLRYEVDNRLEKDRLITQLDSQWRSSYTVSPRRMYVIQLER